MNRIAQSKFFSVLAAAALFYGAMSQAQATPLDKLSGQSIAVGNLIFSNFHWPFFTGAGPSNIDVQGIVLTDHDTGMQQAGLRFVVIQSGVPKPFTVSPKGGPHEISFEIEYSVTDTTGQLNSLTQSINASAVGPGAAAVGLGTQAIHPTDTSGFGWQYLQNPNLTAISTCIATWCNITVEGALPGFPRVVTTTNPGPVFSAQLVAGTPTYLVQTGVSVLIQNSKGVPGGTATLQQFEVLFSE